MSFNVEIIGYLAGGLTTIALLIQTIKMFKERRTNAVSLFWSLLCFLSGGLWVLYAILIENKTLIITNSVILALNLIIMLKKAYNIVKKID